MIPRQHTKILCVDDDQTVLDWLATTLNAAGYEVELAQNGYVGMVKVGRDLHRFGLIIIDLRMPGLDGFGFIEQSRSAGYDGKLLVYAAAITADARDRLRELRVDGVIEKPVRGGDLVEGIRQVMSGS